MNTLPETLFYGLGVFVQSVISYFNTTAEYDDCKYCEFYDQHIIQCDGDDCNV